MGAYLKTRKYNTPGIIIKYNSQYCLNDERHDKAYMNTSAFFFFLCFEIKINTKDTRAKTATIAIIVSITFFALPVFTSSFLYQ